MPQIEKPALVVRRRFFGWLASLIASVRLGRAQGSASPFVSGAWSGNVSSTSATVCIPKNFASRVRVRSDDGHDDRGVVIFMNNPLRYQGQTYY